MKKISFLAQDYKEMGEVACGNFYLGLAECKAKAINPKTLLTREDTQEKMAQKMTDDYIYDFSSHPLVQEMAEDAGIKDWTDEDEEIWNYNRELIYIAMRAFLTKHIERLQFNGYNTSH